MKKTAIKYYLFSVVILLIFYYMFLFLSYDDFSWSEIFSYEANSVYIFYSENMRGHLFAGFLGLGGFLLSLKTFIIVNMKENLYDNETYIEKWKQSQKYSSKTLFAPLKELSDILYYAIFTCIIAAIAQMTLGFVEHDVFALICFYLCISATVLLVKSLIIIKRNLNTWFEFLDVKY